MIFKTMVGLLIAMIVCSCSQQTTKGGLLIDSGLLIDNGINRGISYTDSLGSKYNLRYIPITITNDSTISIRLRIVFSKEYNYPHPDTNETFKLIPLPEEWALDGVGITDSMVNEIPNYIDKPILNETVEPGEKLVVAIGTLYTSPTTTGGVLPNTLFAHSDRGIFPTCDWLMKEYPSSNPQIALGLKLNFGESCTIIPCGQISYPER